MGGTIGSVTNSMGGRYYESPTTVDDVRETINKHRVVIFSKSYCPSCNIAKLQFMKLGEEVHIMELDKWADGQQIQDALLRICGKRSVPRCFVNGQYVGGALEVKYLYEEGKLKQYCENCF